MLLILSGTIIKDTLKTIVSEWEKYKQLDVSDLEPIIINLGKTTSGDESKSESSCEENDID